jgi:hypothetical protein
MKPPIRTEFEEQTALVHYLELLKSQGKIVVFSASPNNTYTKSFSQRRKQVAEGVRKGMPDLCIVSPKDVIFIEMKRVKGGVLSTEQKEWGNALISTGSVKYSVCKGFQEAKEFLESVL